MERSVHPGAVFDVFENSGFRFAPSGLRLLRINRLEYPSLSHIGRPGLSEGTRELVEPPYIVIYEVDEAADEISVLAVMHGARDREGRE